MQKIHLLSSDLDQDILFLDNLKHRDIGQQFNYMDQYAELYCQKDKRQNDGSVPDADDLAQCLLPYLSKERSTAILSVGCADGTFEEAALQILQKEGYRFSYFGLDSSRAMLDLASQTFEKVPYDVHLLFGDFMSPLVNKEVTSLTSMFSNRIFLFLGSTIGNLTQSAAVDSLYNTLDTNETVILEAGIRPSLSKEDDLKIFKRCKARLHDLDWMKLYFGPLENAKVPFENGIMTLETSKEDAVEAIKATFSFKILHKTEINYRGETMHFIPGEKIKLIDIHMYHPDTLIHNIEARGFILKKTIFRNRRGMYAFMRR